MSVIDSKRISEWRARLEQHEVYDQIRDLAALRVFMQHQVWSVWDFMSLIK